MDGGNVQRPREDLVVVLSESLAVQNGRLRVTTGTPIKGLENSVNHKYECLGQRCLNGVIVFIGYFAK